MITRAADICMSNFELDHSLPSDHAAINFASNVVKPRLPKATKQHRVLKNIDKSRLKDLIVSSIESMDDNLDVHGLFYRSLLTNALDEVAPVKTKAMCDKPRSRWFSNDLLEERKALISLERKFLKSGLKIDRQYCSWLPDLCTICILMNVKLPIIVIVLSIVLSRLILDLHLPLLMKFLAVKRHHQRFYLI